VILKTGDDEVLSPGLLLLMRLKLLPAALNVSRLFNSVQHKQELKVAGTSTGREIKDGKSYS
jgi:hypothetical protein